MYQHTVDYNNGQDVKSSKPADTRHSWKNMFIRSNAVDKRLANVVR